MFILGLISELLAPYGSMRHQLGYFGTQIGLDDAIAIGDDAAVGLQFTLQPRSAVESKATRFTEDAFQFGKAWVEGHN